MMPSPRTVYIVDDEPSVRQAVARLVQSAGMCAQVFAAVPDLLGYDLFTEPACVVADIRLPDLSVLELTGLLKRPAPFVLRKELGDFAVTHELNAYCGDPANMARIYSALHDIVVDLFNKYEVAIMTPSYEADPAEPKLLPEDEWYAPPAASQRMKASH